jgi:hypothetical protein
VLQLYFPLFTSFVFCWPFSFMLYSAVLCCKLCTWRWHKFCKACLEGPDIRPLGCWLPYTNLLFLVQLCCNGITSTVAVVSVRKHSAPKLFIFWDWGSVLCLRVEYH